MFFYAIELLYIDWACVSSPDALLETAKSSPTKGIFVSTRRYVPGIRLVGMLSLIHSCIELQGALERVVKQGDFTTA